MSPATTIPSREATGERHRIGTLRIIRRAILAHAALPVHRHDLGAWVITRSHRPVIEVVFGLAAPGSPPARDMVWVPGGSFLMGSKDFYPEERPVHRVTVDGFWRDEHPVTAAEFRRFVR